MVGGQHRAAGFQLMSAVKSARFMISLLALVVLPVALLGLTVYVLLTGTYADLSRDVP